MLILCPRFSPFPSSRCVTSRKLLWKRVARTMGERLAKEKESRCHDTRSRRFLTFSDASAAASNRTKCPRNHGIYQLFRDFLPNVKDPPVQHADFYRQWRVRYLPGNPASPPLKAKVVHSNAARLE